MAKNSTLAERVNSTIEEQAWFKPVDEFLGGVVGQAYEALGPSGARVKNFLQGTWLGHPLHPVITDVPVGAWTAALVLDGMSALSDNENLRAGADTAVALGFAAAIAAAMTGLTDWNDTSGQPRREGLVHALLNGTATLFYAASLIFRWRDRSGAGRSLASLGYLTASVAAYLGGDLVFGKQIGVNHASDQSLPKTYKPVLPEEDLVEGKLRKVEVGGIEVLLARCGSQVYALAATCSHLGGPLAEGKQEGCSVVCPWHDSRFDLRDGHVLDGPATFPQPSFKTRIRDGQIEVRGNGR